MSQLTAVILVLFPEITFEGIRLNICFRGYTTETGTSVKEFKHDPASHLDKELTKRVKLLHLENQRTDKLFLAQKRQIQTTAAYMKEDITSLTERVADDSV
ncbi:hypothetical protein CEXT_329361 [Caerostris extrusa]|uniref:Uncharacterized protein n=1 Tax=Caerostris extrusa TaxID=172846 RepID=A0AAV4R812_CAEEX|nr:hypothetical protein CEXT_329361 [Caerostris extrusa]